MDRGLNEAFAPTREQQQQQTKSQKQQQQQQQKNTINLKAINKENNKPTSRFFWSRQDYKTIGNLQAKYRAQPSWYSPQP